MSFSIPANLASKESYSTKVSQNGITSQATFTVKTGLAQNLKVWSISFNKVFL